MATVRKRKWTHNGERKETWVVEYTDQGGKRRRFTPKSGLKRDADKERLRIESEVEGGIHVTVSESVTISQAVREFLMDCQRRKAAGDLTGGGLKGYGVRLKHVESKFGTRNVTSLTAGEFQGWFDDLTHLYSGNTVVGIHSSVCSLLTYCVRRRWLKRNVLRDEPVRLPRKQRRTAIPSKADLEALLAAVELLKPNENIHTHVCRYASVAFGIFCGLRPGEVMGVQWEDFDFVRNVLNVQHSLSPYDGLKCPKSHAGIRKVPLTTPAIRALKLSAKLADIQAAARAPGFKDYKPSAISARIRRRWREPIDPSLTGRSGFVLSTRYNKPMKGFSSTAYWHVLMQEAGLYDEEAGKPKFTPHALRHAAASLWIEQGMPTMNLKSVMGHANVQTTFNIYGHLFPEDKRTSEVLGSVAGTLDATRARQAPITS